MKSRSRAGIVIALVVAIVSWRLLATGYERIAHASTASLEDRAKWLTADFERRLDATIGGDAKLVREIKAHVPADGVVVVFGTDVAGAPSKRDRLALLRMRLLSLLYPLPVMVGVGPIKDPAQYAALLTPGIWLLNATPEVARPLAEHFKLVATAEGCELSQCLGSKP